VPGLINLDFGDVKTIMADGGCALMGMGEAQVFSLKLYELGMTTTYSTQQGADRATQASTMAVKNPLLDHSSLSASRGVIVNVTGGKDMTLDEVSVAVQGITSEAPPTANIIFGAHVRHVAPYWLEAREGLPLSPLFRLTKP